MPVTIDDVRHIASLARLGLTDDRAAALEAGMKEVESASGANRRTAATKLDGLAADLARDAAKAVGPNAARMKAAAATIQKTDAEMKK